MSYEVKLEEESGYDITLVLSVIRNGKTIRQEYDNGEIEDKNFYRDFSWVPEALMEAYEFGLEDGRKDDGLKDTTL